MLWNHTNNQAMILINEPTFLLEYLDLSGYTIRDSDCSIREFQFFCKCISTYSFKNSNNNNFTYKTESWCTLWSYLMIFESLMVSPSDIVY